MFRLMKNHQMARWPQGMIPRMILRMILAAAVVFAAPPAVMAAPTGVALIIGNAAYSALPGLPGCTLSARAIAAALRGQGYDADAQSDLAIGQMDAAISAFGEKLTANKGLPAIVYICGYGASFNGRPFLLPVSANPARPSDVLSQGVLGKVITDTLTRAGVETALVVLDVLPTPGSAETVPLNALDQPDLPPGIALLGVTETAADSPTPLALTLVPPLKEPRVTVRNLFSAVLNRLGTMRTVGLTLSRSGSGTGLLAGAPPTPPAPVAAQAAEPAAAAAPAQSAPPVRIQANEAQMNDADRRVIQAGLARLGYYGGAVDGVFGADTRAAMRRFQHELSAPMTGQLTQEQLNRLLSTQ